MRDNILLVVLLVLVAPFSTFSQDDGVAITCQFAKKGNPIEKSLLGNDRLKVNMEIKNVSGDELLVPSPGSFGITGNPSLSVITPSGDSLECELKSSELIPVPARFEEISFVKLPPGTTLRVSTDVLDGCDFNFQDGKEYKIVAEFRSVYNGTIEVDGEKTTIWQGAVRSKSIAFTFED